MNRKQLIVIWAGGVILSLWFTFWIILIMNKGSESIDYFIDRWPALVMVNIFFILPIIIIGGLLIYTFMSKRK